MFSETESPSVEVMDYLREAVAGEYGYFYIQAKDAFGNNQIKGGDDFQVKFVNQAADSTITYRGNVDDHGDGTYTVRYTIKVAGTYNIEVTLASSGADEPVLQCTPPTLSDGYIFDRVYDGVDAYYAPNICTLASSSLTVVHNDLYAPTTTTRDDANDLVYAIVGETNNFYIEGRDEFGNLRKGDPTTHFLGYADGQSDYFLMDFTQQETGDHHQVSSAVDIITASVASGSDGHFQLSFGGKTTRDIPSTVSATGLEAILEQLHDYQLDVVVSKTTTGTSIVVSEWRVMFLTMFNVWQSMPPSGSATGEQLSLVPSTFVTNSMTG
jgi:hypothetical protein